MDFFLHLWMQRSLRYGGHQKRAATTSPYHRLSPGRLKSKCQSYTWHLERNRSAQNSHWRNKTVRGREKSEVWANPLFLHFLEDRRLQTSRSKHVKAARSEPYHLDLVRVFFPVKPQMPVTQKFLNFVTATFDFWRAFFPKFSRARPKLSRAIFPKFFHGQAGKFTGISKNSCHGHFCAMISKFLIYSWQP